MPETTVALGPGKTPQGTAEEACGHGHGKRRHVSFIHICNVCVKNSNNINEKNVNKILYNRQGEETELCGFFEFCRHLFNYPKM
ncbi:hypothetical protein EBO34_08650 [Alteribacter keqinensis]|uniref:Uncharacterized protein n=1 Tax=Alteribacter keqinensis TaxID=2483800 RepID=A0A3M7TYX3_9BACI|nr:hypothetical protein EBO34_08650 [Alteribacter keqinensis]